MTPRQPPLSPEAERLAIDRARHSDVNAFNLLVVAYQNLAYSVAYRMLQEESAAADAVQDSFIKAYRALHSFNDGSFKSWLMRIVVNTCYDVLRVRQRRTIDSLSELEVSEEHLPELAQESENPLEILERQELSETIERGIAALPEDQRVVITLCDVHGYSYEEIAEITGMPIGTVKSRISRGRGRLRDYLLRRPELLPMSLRRNRE